MDKQLKLKIKSEIKQIINEIEYEEYMFNKIFHSNIKFEKSYFKFNTIFEKYGKEAYLKYVPLKYKKQELKSLIFEKKYLEIYEHYGATTLQNLEYTADITKKEFLTNSKFKLFFINISKFLSRKFIFLPKSSILLLPEKLPNYNE